MTRSNGAHDALHLEDDEDEEPVFSDPEEDNVTDSIPAAEMMPPTFRGFRPIHHRGEERPLERHHHPGRGER